ncbi:MAG: sulfotransferase [Methylococcales bacterium]
MQADHAFYRLPLLFDVRRLEQEIAQFQAGDWTPHEGEAAGQAAIFLVSVGGTSNADFAMSGPVAPTRFLAGNPYLQQVLQAFGSAVSRSRLLRLPGQTTTPVRAECNYHWFRHVLVYVPIVTGRPVTFFCQGEGIPMAAGEAWRVDPAGPHWMSNQAKRDCIYLIIELRKAPPGQPACFEAATAGHPDEAPIRCVPYVPDQPFQVPLEHYSFEVLSPAEIGDLSTEILAAAEAARMPRQAFVELARSIQTFRQRWAGTFARYGHRCTGELAYQDLITDFQEQIATRARKWPGLATQRLKAIEVIRSMLWRAPPAPARLDRRLLARRKRSARPAPEDFQCPVFDRPLFIVSAPRAGSTLLFETLARLPDIWTIGQESHETIEGIPELHPASRQYCSNRLTEADAPPHIAATLRERIVRQLEDRAGQAYLDLPAARRPKQIRFLEKTPKNALRIPFLRAVFPDALFIYLYRDPAENISSLLEGWRSRRFIAYRHLPGWPFREWSFLLVPGWSTLRDRALVDIAAYQWKVANACILHDLEALPACCCYSVRYSSLVRAPESVIRDINHFAGLRWDRHVEEAVSEALPLSPRTLSAPSPEKWRKNAREIATVLATVEHIVSDVDKRINRRSA